MRESCCATLMTHNIHIQREGGRKEVRERRESPPRSHGSILQKCPESPLWSVHSPDHYLASPRSNRNIRLARKEKMFPFEVLPASTKSSIVPAGWCVVFQGHASLPFTGCFEDTQRAAAWVAGPQSDWLSAEGRWLKTRSPTRQAQRGAHRVR